MVRRCWTGCGKILKHRICQWSSSPRKVAPPASTLFVGRESGSSTSRSLPRYSEKRSWGLQEVPMSNKAEKELCKAALLTFEDLGFMFPEPELAEEILPA